MVAWDGKTQDILMSFNVSGSSDKAAWVMPVPSAAKVSLGDTEVFDELARLTAPRVEYRDSWWPTFTWLLPGATSSLETAGAPGGAVNVLGHQRIGPFDVTRLAANDSDRVGYVVGGQGISASGRPRSEPRAVHRGPLGNRGDTARSCPGG